MQVKYLTSKSDIKKKCTKNPQKFTSNTVNNSKKKKKKHSLE